MSSVDPSSGQQFDPWAPTQQSPAPGGHPGYPPPQRPSMPPHGYPQPAYRPAPKSSGAATASLVLGILGLVGGWATAASLSPATLVGGIVCVLAITFGWEGLRRARGGSQGRQNAVAGLILGCLSLLIWLGIFAVRIGGSLAE